MHQLFSYRATWKFYHLTHHATNRPSLFDIQLLSLTFFFPVACKRQWNLERLSCHQHARKKRPCLSSMGGWQWADWVVYLIMAAAIGTYYGRWEAEGSERLRNDDIPTTVRMIHSLRLTTPCCLPSSFSRKKKQGDGDGGKSRRWIIWLESVCLSWVYRSGILSSVSKRSFSFFISAVLPDVYSVFT